MIAWASLVGAVLAIGAAVARMQTRASPPRRDRGLDHGDWPPDQMAL
jgi:hypothetical protein